MGISEDKTEVTGVANLMEIENCKPSMAELPVSGTVKLFEEEMVVLIPTPTPDPKDPLNLPTWRKYFIILLVGLYSAISVLGTSGLGSIRSEVEKMYPNESSAAIDNLLTWPNFFMSVGNLIAMPLNVAIGRRPVFLMFLALLIVSGIWCAASTSLNSHIAGRDFFSIAAGQSEALAPLMVQEIHFMHEHGSKIAYFVGVQCVGTAVGFLATNYIASNLGVRWWYGFMTIVNGVVFILSVFFVAETRYDRPRGHGTLGINGQVEELKIDKKGNVYKAGSQEVLYDKATKKDRFLDPATYGPRTWRDELRLFHFKPTWKDSVLFYENTFKGLLLPTIFWLLLLNGACLGIYVYQASTFSTVLMSPPYSFHVDWLGFVQVTQVIDTMVMIPVLGYGSDFICKVLSKWRGGIFQPEYRLITLLVPASAAIISCTIYGQAATNPDQWPWVAIAAPYHLGYFSFLGANLAAITYAIDSFPEQTGPLLLVICAGRGFFAFGLSYSTVPITDKLGYDGAMNIYAIICGILFGLGVPAYIFGGWIRKWATRHFWPTTVDEE